MSKQLFLPCLDLSQTFLDLKSDKWYNILGYYSKVPTITKLFKPNQNPIILLVTLGLGHCRAFALCRALTPAQGQGAESAKHPRARQDFFITQKS